MNRMEIIFEKDGEEHRFTLEEAMRRIAVGFAFSRAEDVNEKDEWYTTPRWLAAYALSYLTGEDEMVLYDRLGESASTATPESENPAHD